MAATRAQPSHSWGGRLAGLSLALLLSLAPAAGEEQELGRVEALERELNMHLQSQEPGQEQPQGVMYKDYFPTTRLLTLPNETHLDTYEVSNMDHVAIVTAQLEVIIPRMVSLPSFLPVIGAYLRRIEEAERFLDSECGAVTKDGEGQR